MIGFSLVPQGAIASGVFVEQQPVRRFSASTTLAKA